MDENSEKLVAINVCVSNCPLDKITNFYSGNVFVGGLFRSEVIWPKDNLLLMAGGLPILKKQWLKQLPNNEPSNVQMNVTVGKTTNFSPTTQLVVSQHHKLEWKDVPANGRYFSAECQLSEPMFKSVMIFASNNKTVYSDKFENVIILPMPHACEPDDTPLNSPRPLRTHRPIALTQILIGHLNSENQQIITASILTEKSTYSQTTREKENAKRWWKRLR